MIEKLYRIIPVDFNKIVWILHFVLSANLSSLTSLVFVFLPT